MPGDIRALWTKAGQRSKDARKAWDKRLGALDAAKRAEFERRMSGELPKAKLAAAVKSVKETLAATPKDIATRSSSEFALESLAEAVPEMIGGSADLTGSNNTRTKAMKAMSPNDYGARFIHYGIREHGMAAAMNGMTLHGGIIPYSGTFLVFSDYCRPAIRLAALMGERVIHVMTHDFDRPRRRRPDASAGRASRGACARFRICSCSVRATRSRRWNAGNWPCNRKTARACSR